MFTSCHALQGNILLKVSFCFVSAISQQNSAPILALCYAEAPAPEAEASFGPGDAAELSSGRDVAMASTAPADADLLDDADTETTATAADR